MKDQLCVLQCESYRRVRETSSWAALLWQCRPQRTQTEQSTGTPPRPHTHTHHTDRTAGTDPGSPDSGTGWTRLTSSPHTPLLQNALKEAAEVNLLSNLWLCFPLYVCYTSFGVDGTWISLMSVGRFTVSIDPPCLAESLRTRLNQTRSRQEVITLVTIKVSTETTSLSCPSGSQLWRKTGFSKHVCLSYNIWTIAEIKILFPLNWLF